LGGLIAVALVEASYKSSELGQPMDLGLGQ
jgi:hypothetical protein